MTEINAKVKNSVHTTNKLASSGNTKKPLLANITTFMKRGSDVVKDKVSKIGTLFKKKVNNPNQGIGVNKHNVNILSSNAKQPHSSPSTLSEKVQLPITPNENKHIFKIEEDEEAKEYSYNLNQPDSDDEDDDYEENDSDENDDKKQTVDKNIISKENDQNNALSQEKAQSFENSKEKKLSNSSDVNENLSGRTLSTNADFDFSQEEYETQSVCHRLYTKREDSGRIHVTLEFMKDLNSEDIISKNLFFEEREAEKFVTIFNIYLKRLNINLTDENEQYYQEEDNQDNQEYEEDHDPHEEINAQRKNSHNSNDEETKQSDI